MKILSLDSSATSASVALCEDERIIEVYNQQNGLTHSQTLLPMIDAVLKNASLTVDDIDMLACSDGPGSFTGVRIGASVLKGLAFGKNKICVGVSTLDALARNAHGLDGSFLAVPVMDARRSQLYNAVFSYEDGVMTRLTEDRLITCAELEEELKNAEKPIYFFGDGYMLAKKLALPTAKNTPRLLITQNAASVALAAIEKYNNTQDKSIFTDTALRPQYLRASQAEREELEKKKGQRL